MPSKQEWVNKLHSHFKCYYNKSDLKKMSKEKLLAMWMTVTKSAKAIPIKFYKDVVGHDRAKELYAGKHRRHNPDDKLRRLEQQASTGSVDDVERYKQACYRVGICECGPSDDATALPRCAECSKPVCSECGLKCVCGADSCFDCEQGEDSCSRCSKALCLSTAHRQIPEVKYCSQCYEAQCMNCITRCIDCQESICLESCVTACGQCSMPVCSGCLTSNNCCWSCDELGSDPLGF